MRLLRPLTLRFLVAFYTNQSIRIQWGSAMSTICSVSNGVMQGRVVSPIHFTVYINEPLSRLSATKLGCYIGNMFCGALGYTNDITPSSLKYMLNICHQFAEAYDV